MKNKTNKLILGICMFQLVLLLIQNKPIERVNSTVIYVTDTITVTDTIVLEKIVNSVRTINNPYAPISVKHLEDFTPNEFIKNYVGVAQEEMKIYGIPASITLAQGLIESAAGNSKLAVNNNNYFGVKCWSKTCKKGHCSNHYDDGHKDFFRIYNSTWQSFRDHSKVLQKERYKKLYTYGKDYKKWAKGLKKAGYATDKRYDKKLINVIQKYKLYEYDK